MFVHDNDAMRMLVRERHEQLAQDARPLASRQRRARKRRVLVVSLSDLLDLRHRRAHARAEA